MQLDGLYYPSLIGVRTTQLNRHVERDRVTSEMTTKTSGSLFLRVYGDSHKLSADCIIVSDMIHS